MSSLHCMQSVLSSPVCRVLHPPLSADTGEVT
jgi:hypothetical protein